MGKSVTRVAKKKRIAVYHGAKNVSGERVAAALRKLGIPFAMIGPAQIERGRLGEFAGVIFPGGHSIQLGSKAIDEVVRFVESGGGFFGICAGCQFGRRIRLLRARWKALRASGIFDMRVVRRHAVTRGYTVAGKHPKGRPWKYSNRGRVRMRYCNGGLLIAGRGAEVLVSFDEEGEFGAIVAGRRRRGRVVLVSSHPESTPTAKDCGPFTSDADRSQDPLELFGNAVRFVAGR
jgi:hypothetical protein